mmetsp:Transcript_18566/g.52405  ORF Transcript_18566/g.52405 Transcript_18566/m.52405 type:complete len:152 (+) Transcript_18566:2-457(+)
MHHAAMGTMLPGMQGMMPGMTGMPQLAGGHLAPHMVGMQPPPPMMGAPSPMALPKACAGPFEGAEPKAGGAIAKPKAPAEAGGADGRGGAPAEDAKGHAAEAPSEGNGKAEVVAAGGASAAPADAAKAADGDDEELEPTPEGTSSDEGEDT